MDLNRFLIAQENSFELALSEIRSGRKRSHWMWYIFPQFLGLGFSEVSKHFAIKSIQEAQDYLKHPILGSRLFQITNEVMLVGQHKVTNILDSPDDLKFHSSMTLFSSIDSSEEKVFVKALNQFFDGNFDVRTLELIGDKRAFGIV